MDTLLQDLRFAFRSLRRTPGFTVAAVATLALGIGATTAIFSVVETVALRPIPYPEADRIVYVWEARDGRRMSPTAPDFTDWRAGATSFSALAARAVGSYTLTSHGEPERLTGGRVSAEYFSVLGLRPVVGRAFRPDEDRYGSAPVALLGHGLWQRRFGGDSGIVGQSILLNGVGHEVVGVLQPHARIRDDVYTPLALTPQELSATGAHGYVTAGRLRAGVSLPAAQSEMVGIAARLAEARPGSNTGVGVELVPIRRQIVGTGSTQVLMLLGAALFVSLIACANVANLLLARTAGRGRELSVRAAMGATPTRVVRQLLTESLALAAIGGGLGTLIAFLGLDALVAVLPPNIPRLTEVSIDGTVLGFAAASSLLVGLLFGLAPVLGVLRRSAAVPQAGRGTAGIERRRLRGVLVAAEVASATVLLIGAGLMIRSMWALSQIASGVRPDGVLAARVSLPPARYPTGERMGAGFEAILERLAAIPGARSAALTANIPLSSEGFTISFLVEGRPVPEPDKTPTTLHQLVSPEYFRTLGIGVVRGRTFTAADRATTPRVAVVNEAMARLGWPDGDAVGARVTLDDGVDTPMEIVGVVADVRQYGPTQAAAPELYVPLSQTPPLMWGWLNGSLALLVRTGGVPTALAPQVRSAVWGVDRDLPVFGLTTLEQVLDGSVASSRLLMYLLGAFATLALVLAAVGIYGVIAFTVAQRTRELGIRVALGATSATVRGLVLKQGMAVVGVGVVVGLLASVGLTRVLAASLFGVRATDAVTFLGVAAVLSGVAALACYLPAGRAARVDPAVALRAE